MYTRLVLSAFLISECRRVNELRVSCEEFMYHGGLTDSARILALLFLASDYRALAWHTGKHRSLRNTRKLKSSGLRSTLISNSEPSGLRVDRQISVPIEILLHRRWVDITADIATSLPPLPYSIATVSCLNEYSHCCSLALLDPKLLEVGPLEAVVPERLASICVGVRNGALLLPAGARIVLLMEMEGKAGHDEDYSTIPLDISIEATDSLLTAPNGLAGPEAIAQAALRAALLDSGVNGTVLAALESSPEQRPANRVYETFVTKTYRPEELLHAARRTAHHVHHLLRQEAAQAAEYLINNDTARNRSGISDSSQPPHPLYLVLDNVRSAYNVGSIFRTADTARCAEVITCGFSPHPPNPKLAKTAFDAVKVVPTHHEENTLHAVRSLQARGIKVYAMETTKHSKNYCKVDFPSAGIALVLGNEEIGVDTRVMSLVDGLVEIPTFGSKNSLNVASAASIVVFEVLRQWGKLD